VYDGGVNALLSPAELLWRIWHHSFPSHFTVDQKFADRRLKSGVNTSELPLISFSGSYVRILSPS